MKNKRTLKIEERGDFNAGKTIPTIRLKGEWLRAAGFNPGATVELTAVSPGVIEIRVNSPVQINGESFQIMGRIDRAIEKYDKSKPGKAP